MNWSWREGDLTLERINKVLLRVGFHAVYEKSIREAIDLAFEYGFTSVQIETAMPQFFPEKYTVETREEIRCYAEEKNITLKVHAPGEDFSLQTLHASIQRAIIKRLKEVIDFAGDLGAKLVTIHPGTVPVFSIAGKGNIPIDAQYPQLHFQSLKAAFLELSSYSEGKTWLCIENSPFTYTVMEVLSEILEGGNVFLTWDLAKMYGGDGTICKEIEAFFLEHLDKVRECHLHDLSEEHGHLIIGSGFVDFKRYLDLLSNYSVEYTIEVRPVGNALKSLEGLKKILES